MENDTIALLKECNSGIKMGVTSLSDVLDHVKESNLRKVLVEAKQEHEKLGDETHEILLKYHEDDKEPHPVAKMMASMKTGTKLALEESDQTIAGLITDGCDMGIKSLHQYLNKYENAEKDVKDMTKKVIASEENLRKNLQAYL
ncbi:MAG: hypothetical protein IJY09_11795 [Lachnospiraceae bacterium]|nr:hypothetical protein [Lachnospiraceae bacterium]